MTWRISTQHRSVYHYQAPVVASYNEARLTPATSPRQSVISSSVVINPAGPRYTYVDYWSSVVVAFDVEARHEDLTVVGHSLVETAPPPMQSECGWEDLGDEQVTDRYAELLMPTPYTASDGELDALAREFATAPSPHDAIEATGRWMRDTLTYAVGTTEVSTSALEAWRQGSGVCQDFAHLTLALLRAMGIPSRYVSGYIHPEVDPVVGTTVSGASHAWVEAWLGDWRAFDPTNGAAVGERHITVAQGRDYADVAPLRGVYRGGALEALEVSVELTRVQ